MKVKFLKLAFKNVTRNRRRTIITAGIILFGSTALIVAGGFFQYSFWGLSERVIRGQYGHLQIFTPEFVEKVEDMPLQFGLEQPDSLIRIVEMDQKVDFAMARIRFMGLLSNGEKSVTFIGRAVMPSRERKLSDVAQLVTTGSYLSDENSPQMEHEVILADGLARSVKAQIGDYLTALVTTTSGALNAIDLKVVGFISTGVPEMDAHYLYVKLPTAQELLQTSRVTNLVVVLHETEETDASAIQLSGQLAPLVVKKWYELDPFYQSVVQLYNAIFTFLGVIIFIVVLLAVSNTMMMSIFERTREIGTLMAVGTSNRRILNNFLLEGVVIGSIAGMAGLFFALVFSFLLNHAGFMMPPPPGSTLGYPLNVHYVPAIYAGTFVFMLFTTLLSTFFPAWRASRMNIVDALGHI